MVSFKSQVLALFVLCTPLSFEMVQAKPTHAHGRGGGGDRKTKRRDTKDGKSLIKFAKDMVPPKADGGSITPKIIGGSNAPRNAYPWYAKGLDTYDGSWWGCGGTLVAPEFVLTAAHCDFGAFYSGFEIGALCEDVNNCGQRSEVIRAIAVFDHPYWSSYDIDYDYSLVQLESQSTIDPVPMDQGNVSTSYFGGRSILF